MTSNSNRGCLVQKFEVSYTDPGEKNRWNFHLVLYILFNFFFTHVVRISFCVPLVCFCLFLVVQGKAKLTFGSWLTSVRRVMIACRRMLRTIAIDRVEQGLGLFQTPIT